MLARLNDRMEFPVTNDCGGVEGQMASGSVSGEAVKQGSTNVFSLRDPRLWQELSSEHEVKGVDPGLVAILEAVEDDRSDVT